MDLWKTTPLRGKLKLGPLSQDSLLLQLIQPEIKPIALHEFAVGAGFDDPAPVQYDNPVCFPGGRQSVGDHDGCSGGHQICKRLLDFTFGY